MEVSRARSDLQERTFVFARDIRGLVRLLPRNIVTNSAISQCIQSSGLIGVNCIEAQEAMSRKDFGIHIARKKAKEMQYWLGLLEEVTSELAAERRILHKEAPELLKIVSAIVKKVPT